jgi:thioredoxin 1
MMTSPSIVPLVASTFDTITSRGLWVLDFSAERCAPCRALVPILDALATEYTGHARFAMIDADHEPELAARFAVRSLPTLVLWRDGRDVGRVVGLRPRAFIAGVIDRALGGDVAIASP